MRWVRELAASNTVGEEWRRFRVKALGPKGLRLVTSGQFVCRGSGAVPRHTVGPDPGSLKAIVAAMRSSNDPLDQMAIAVLDSRLAALPRWPPT